LTREATEGPRFLLGDKQRKSHWEEVSTPSKKKIKIAESFYEEKNKIDWGNAKYRLQYGGSRRSWGRAVAPERKNRVRKKNNELADPGGSDQTGEKETSRTERLKKTKKKGKLIGLDPKPEVRQRIKVTSLFLKRGGGEI